MNATKQSFAWKDKGSDDNVKRRDVIAVCKDILNSAKNCSIHWCKPEAGIFYGTFLDGSFNISVVDTGDKSLADAVAGEVTWKNTKEMLKSEKVAGALDLGSWGCSIQHQYLSNSNAIDCSGKRELVVHFALSAATESAVIIDQVSKKGEVNSFVQRAGCSGTINAVGAMEEGTIFNRDNN